MGWLLATIAPWWLLDHQQHLHRSDDREALWPLYAIVTGGLFGLFAFLLAFKDRVADLSGFHLRRSWRLAAGALLLLPAAFLLQRELRAFARTVWFRPMSPAEGDMLPLMLSTLGDFWRDGVYPYRVHEVATWDLALTFTPGLWLPYSVPYLAGLDIRWAGVAAMAAAGLACFIWTGWTVLRNGNPGNWLSALPVLWLPFGMLWLEYYDDFLGASHLAVYWAVAILAAMALRLRLHGTAGLLLGWCLLARVYLLFAVPFLLIHACRLWRKDRRGAQRLAAGFLVPGVLVGLPFLLWDPAGFTRGLLSGYGEQLSWHIAETPFFAHGIGWTGLLQQVGLDGWRMPLALCLQVPLWIDAWHRLRDERDVLLYSAIAMAVFLSFSIVPWFYVYTLPLVFLAFAFPREQLAVPRGRHGAFVLAGGTLVGAGIALAVLLWGGTRDVRYARFPKQEGSPLFFEASHPLQGFAFHGWIGNEPGAWRPVTGEDAFVALPVRETSVEVVEIEYRGAPSGSEPAVYVNHEPARLLPGTGSGRIQAVIPPGNLFRGGNLIRIRLLAGEGKPVTGWDLGRIELRNADAGR